MHAKRVVLLLIIAIVAAGCDSPGGSARPTPSPSTTASKVTSSAGTPGGPVLGPDSYGPLTLGMTVEQAQKSDPTMEASRNNGGSCDIRVSDLGRLQFRDGVLVQIEADRDAGAATPEGVRSGDLIGFAAGRYENPTITSQGVVAVAPGSTIGSSYLFDNPSVTPDAVAKNDFGTLRIGFIAVRRDGFCNYN